MSEIMDVRVARGVALLDALRPEWVAEIGEHGAVHLDMRHGDRCVLGRLAPGLFSWERVRATFVPVIPCMLDCQHVQRNAPRADCDWSAEVWAMEYGFTSPMAIIYSGRADYGFPDLTEAWRKVIIDRLILAAAYSF